MYVGSICSAGGTQSPRDRVAPRITTPARMNPTAVAIPQPYPWNSAMKPPRSGPRMEPNPCTALYAPMASARPSSGASSDTRVEPETLIRAQQRPTAGGAPLVGAPG